jgi:hypothetical protein
LAAEAVLDALDKPPLALLMVAAEKAEMVMSLEVLMVQVQVLLMLAAVVEAIEIAVAITLNNPLHQAVQVL